MKAAARSVARHCSGVHVGRVVQLLEDRVDEVAGRVEQEDVVVAAGLQELTDPGVVLGVQPAVLGPVAGRVERFLLAGGVRVVGDVELLQRLLRLGKRGERRTEIREGAQEHLVPRHHQEVALDGPEVVLDRLRLNLSDCFSDRSVWVR